MGSKTQKRYGEALDPITMEMLGVIYLFLACGIFAGTVTFIAEIAITKLPSCSAEVLLN